MSFQDSLTQTLKFEGRYTVDDGGPTNYGITQDTYNSYRYKSVKEITPTEVAAIYQNQYWLEASCDKVDPISSKMSMCLFDLAANSGTVWARKLLQRAVLVTEDGVIGPLTLDAVTSLVKINENAIVGKFLNVRETYDRSLKNWDKYGLSEWLPRINVLRKLLLTNG